MIYTFEEAKKYFSECVFTANGLEMEWYKFGFEILNDFGLLKYQNDIDKIMIYHRIYGLIAMFFEFYNVYNHTNKNVDNYLYFNSDEIISKLSNKELLENFGINPTYAKTLSDENFAKILTHDKIFIQKIYRVLRKKFSFNEIYNLLNYICADEYPDYCYENYADTQTARIRAFSDIPRLMKTKISHATNLNDNKNSKIWLYKFEIDL